MKTVLLVAILLGAAMALPHKRKHSKEEEEETEVHGEHNPVLTVGHFKGAMYYLLWVVRGAEENITKFVDKAQKDLSPLASDAEVLRGLREKWQGLGQGVGGVFSHVSTTLFHVLIGMYYHAFDFDGTNECSGFENLAHEMEAPEGGPSEEQQTDRAVQLVVYEFPCFEGILKRLENPENFNALKEKNEINEEQAFEIVYQLLEELHFLLMNGGRFLAHVTEAYPDFAGGDSGSKEDENSEEKDEEDEEEEEEEGGSAGGQEALKRRLLKLVRRLLAKKRTLDESPAQTGEEPENAEDDDEPYEEEPAVPDQLQPLSKAEFFEAIAAVTNGVAEAKAKFQAIVSKLRDASLTSEEKKAELLKFRDEMHTAGEGIHHGMSHLVMVMIRLTMGSVAGEDAIADANKFPLRLSDETLQTADLDNAEVRQELAEDFLQDGQQFRTLLGNANMLKAELDATCDRMTQRTAFRLLRGLFKGMHLVQLAATRFHALGNKFLDDLVEHDSSSVDEVARELLDLMKKELHGKIR
ncbi:uncharacterized protein LOC143297991 [Babylonia areolata]|uniref:uncharacterized protein LOC143297991 n=1 Tax=Babylonia areolata TaxID=304850 RepID=UPI003FD4596F